MKKRTLVVVESWDDVDSYCRERRAIRDERVKHLAKCDHYGELLFCPANELRRTICGYQFYAVVFWDGMYESQDIMYALSRQRYAA